MADSSGLFFTSDWRSNPPQQIWFQPYPTGEPVRISNDLNEYYGISVTADGSSLVAVAKTPAATIYVSDSPPVLNEKVAWHFVAISKEQVSGHALAWTPSGKLLQLGADWHAYSMEADGSEKHRLQEGDRPEYWITACGSNRIVVSQLSKTNANDLWQLDLSSGELKQLTDGDEDTPACSPDGSFLVYAVNANGKPVRVMKMSLETGDKVELATLPVGSIAAITSISPDGALLVYYQVSQSEGATPTFVLRNLSHTESPPKEIHAPSTVASLGWTPNGQALAYTSQVGNSWQLFMQPLAGGPPIQLTHVDSEPLQIVAFAWSQGGKKLAITRQHYRDSDVAMFSRFR